MARNICSTRYFPINVGIIRATTGDPDGNLTMEKEALTLEALAIAMAARNSGGIVIAQVERVAESGSLNPRQVKVPGVLVDCVVVARPENHWQTFATQYNPAYSAEIRARAGSLPPMEDGARKIIARRAALELEPNSVVNLGIGMPEGVAAIANEEKIVDLITLTAEPGVIGGIPASGMDFGAAINTQAVIDQPYQFDFYDGGGLDVAFLGLAQADRAGNPQRLEIRAAARWRRRLHQHQPERQEGGVRRHLRRGRTADRLSRRQTADRARRRHPEIREQGRACHVQRAMSRARTGKSVLYITERCVFRLATDGLELIEIAPGVDLDRDILAQDGFQAADPEAARPDGSAHLRRRPDGIARSHAVDPARTALHLRRERRIISSSISNASRCATKPTSSASGRSSTDRLAPLGKTRLRHRQLRQFHDRCRNCSTNIRPWCAG